MPGVLRSTHGIVWRVCPTHRFLAMIGPRVRPLPPSFCALTVLPPVPTAIPQGTPKRWEAVAAYIRTRSLDEVGVLCGLLLCRSVRALGRRILWCLAPVMWL